MKSIPDEKLQLASCQKYPLANISALGVGFQPLEASNDDQPQHRRHKGKYSK